MDALTGRSYEARGELRQLIKMSRLHWVEPVEIAYIYTALGDKDNAFHWLEEAYKSSPSG
jgi:hypothetical protein